jgi:hypothetical protein
VRGRERERERERESKDKDKRVAEIEIKGKIGKVKEERDVQIERENMRKKGRY